MIHGESCRTMMSMSLETAKLILEIIVAAVTLPSVLNPWLGVGVIFGAIVIGLIFLRNRWRKMAVMVVIVGVMQIPFVHAGLTKGDWREWARNLPTTLRSECEQAAVERALMDRAWIINRGSYGRARDRFVDIQPKWMTLANRDYWRIVLHVNEGGKVTRIESMQM